MSSRTATNATGSGEPISRQFDLLRERAAATFNAFLNDDSTIVGQIAGKVEAQTKIKRGRFAAGLLGALLIYLMIGNGAQFLCNLIGFCYPCYASIKALESKGVDDDKTWLTYWIVFAFLSLIEFFTDILMAWIPFYFLLKCVLFLWLMAPGQMNGSMVVYRRIVRPFFLSHQSSIDKFTDAAVHAVNGELIDKDE